MKLLIKAQIVEEKEKSIFAECKFVITLRLYVKYQRIMFSSSTSVVNNWAKMISHTMFLSLLLCQHGVGDPNFSPARSTMKRFLKLTEKIFISTPPLSCKYFFRIVPMNCEKQSTNDSTTPSNTTAAAKYTESL